MPSEAVSVGAISTALTGRSYRLPAGSRPGHLIANGTDLVTPGGHDKWHLVQVEQYKARIKLSVNGQVCYEHLDDGSVGGLPIETGGKMSFRQQNNLYRGDYRNFKVFALE